MALTFLCASAFACAGVVAFGLLNIKHKKASRHYAAMREKWRYIATHQELSRSRVDDILAAY